MESSRLIVPPSHISALATFPQLAPVLVSMIDAATMQVPTSSSYAAIPFYPPWILLMRVSLFVSPTLQHLGPWLI
jgi:hypothetical protein